jgi:GT2 family glycosyltransferase
VAPFAQLARVDLAAPPAALRLDGDGPLELVYRWGPTVVGEQGLAAAPGPGEAIPIPEAVVRQARETRLAARLLDVVAARGAGREPAVSVVVCTFRRPDDLADCLASVGALRTPPLEVVVVDNDPADGASRHVAERAGARVVDAPVRGLSAARNAGVRAATGELVAFVDDDCLVDPSWLDGLAADFADPLVAAVVGYVGAAELDTEAQWLFEAQGGFERRFAPAVFDGAARGPWAAAGLGDGNSVFRRAVFERHGGFAEDLGPGTPARSAQDADLFYRLMAAGLRLRFCPARVVWHRHRRDVASLAATLEGYTTGLSAHGARALARRDPAALRLWWWWARHYFPRLARDGRDDPRPGRRALLVAQARGAVLGPWRARVAVARPRPLPAVAAAGPSRARADGPRVTPDAAVIAERASVSVVIASRDRRERLLQTLDALGRQTLPPERTEVVVVLDGSTDGSREAAEALELPVALRVVGQAPAGLAVSRNRGVALATHALVVLLDDDIVPDPGLVAGHVAAHAGGREAIVMGRHPCVRRAGDWWGTIVRAWWADHFRRKSHPAWQPTFVDYCDGNSSIPRSVFDRLGGFDEGFTGGRRQDWELAIRALAAGVPLQMHGDASARHFADPSFASALTAARQEGASDVLIARRHPAAAGRLPLVRPAPRRGLRRLDDGALAAVASGLERAGAYRSWRRWTGAARAAAYARGVQEALSHPGELSELTAATRDDADVLALAVDLDGPPLAVPPAHLGRVALEFGGARHLASVPGETWDAEAVLSALARAAALAGGDDDLPRALAVAA